MYIYPRLETPVAIELLSELSRLGQRELKERSAIEHLRTAWYPTGMNRVPGRQLTELQSTIRVTAREFGHPAAQRQRSFTAFDQSVASKLLATMDILPADAAHEGVWSFLSLVLVPDVAFWRFPNRSFREDYERLLGRPRNVFRRLWWRAFAMGSQASQGLLEDEAVAIMERPTLGGDPRIANAIASTHLAVVAANPSTPRTELLRQVGKRLRRLSAVITLSALGDDDLHRAVREVFDQAIDALRDGTSST